MSAKLVSQGLSYTDRPLSPGMSLKKNRLKLCYRRACSCQTACQQFNPEPLNLQRHPDRRQAFSF